MNRSPLPSAAARPVPASAPRRRAVPAGRALLLGGAALLGLWALQFLAMTIEIKPYDEGLILYGAQQVRRGAVPYRDFWSMYGPGSFYVLAAAFELFGETVTTGRALDAFGRAAIVLVIHQALRPHVGRATAVTAAALAALLLIAVHQYLFPALPATLGCLLGLALADRACARVATAPAGAASAPGAASLASALAAGVVIGSTALVRHDFGVYGAVAVVALIAASERRRAAGGTDRRAACLRRFAIGAALPLGLGAAWFLSQVAIADLVDQLIRIPVEVYAVNRGLPFPSAVARSQEALAAQSLRPLFPLIVWLPLIVIVATLGLAWRQRGARGPAAAARRPLIIGASVLGACLTFKGSVRIELLHMLPALLVGTLLAALAVASLARHGRAVGWVLALVVVPPLAYKLATQPEPRVFDAALAAATADGAPWRCSGQPSPRLGCFRVDAQRARVLAVLAREVAPAARVYIGAGRHDKLFVNNVELYFLSGLPAATRWHDLHPGVQTTRAVQARMLREFAAAPPAAVVQNREWDEWTEPNGSARSSGVGLLDEWLRERYATVAEVGRFTVFLPRPRTAFATGAPP